MTKVLQGERISKDATVVVGPAAFIPDEAGRKILLVRRQDNGQWALPGGHLDAGESIAEACRREVCEEIGLEVEIEKILGIYSSPNRVVERDGGAREQPVNVALRVRRTGGEIRPGSESSDWGYFDAAEIATMDLIEDQREIVDDYFAGAPTPVLR